MRTLQFDAGALKAVSGFPAKQLRQVVSAILDLMKGPRPHYSKQLSGSSYLRLAVGEYRVIFKFDDVSVEILVFGKRNNGEVYRMLDRKN